MKRHAYGGKSLAPTAVPGTGLILLLNPKKLFLTQTLSSQPIGIELGIEFLSFLSEASLRALNPTLRGMLE